MISAGGLVALQPAAGLGAVTPPAAIGHFIGDADMDETAMDVAAAQPVQSVLDRPPPPADERISYGDAPEQFADLRRPERPGPHPAVVFIHGGFWRAAYDLSYAGHPCRALTEAGFVTWNLEYRRLGSPGGGWPGTFLDVAMGIAAFFAAAPDYGVDPARVVVMGHSAGGHLAFWAAGLARVPGGSEIAVPPVPVRAAVSLAGVVDLRSAWELGLSGQVVNELLGGSPHDLPERYAAASPIELLPLGVPQALIHGALDDIVPISLSEGYAAAAQAAGDEAELIALPAAEHFAVVDPESSAWAAVLETVEKLAGTDDAAPSAGATPVWA
jgi:acetyl esterase/lipase